MTTEQQQAGWRVFTEDWDPAYGTPATFDWDDSGNVEQAEPAGGHVRGAAVRQVPLAFVDGTRRVELSLWLEHAMTGERIPGLAGAYAIGAVAVRPDRGACFEGVRVGRIAVWGGGHTGDIWSPLCYRWASDSTTAA